MGETETLTVRPKVCPVEKVDLLPGHNPLQGVIKLQTENFVNADLESPLLPSTLPQSGIQNSVDRQQETGHADSSVSSSVTPTSESKLCSSMPQSSSSNSYDCTTCGKKFSKPSKLKNHLHLHTGARPFACKHTGCDKAYTNSSHLLRHMKTHQASVTPLEICLECKAMFRSAGGLRKHMKTIHSTENECAYSCQECGRAFRKKKLLLYHMHEHGGDPAFRCQHCNVQFTHKYLYNRHMRGHRSHPCRVPGCKQVLENWSLLRKHMAMHNRGQVPDEMPDEKPGEEKTTAETTSDKAQAVQPIRVPGRKCPICDVVIRSRNRYYTHLEQHKEILRCPYPTCNRGYNYKRNLDNHIRTKHSEGSRFVCNVCGRGLASKQKLLLHQRNMHDPDKNPSGVAKKPRSLWGPRKDKGTIKRALAAKLAGIRIPYEQEKRLLQKDEELRKGDPLSTSSLVSSPESGFSSIPGALRANMSGCSDFGLSSETDEGFRTGEPSDASELQGPSETQRRNEDHQESSSEEEAWYSGGESSDEESGSGHCEDEDEEDGEGNDDHDDDEEGDDDDEDDFNEDEEDEGEEGNGNEEEGGEERESDLAQGEGSGGKRAGSESLSRDEIPEAGNGDFGVDRDSTIPSIESRDNIDSPEEFITPDVKSEEQRPAKRKREDDPLGNKKSCQSEVGATAGADQCTLPDKELSRNVDSSIFEVNNAKEKASKSLPEDIWVNTFQTSIFHCLPIKTENSADQTEH